MKSLYEEKNGSYVDIYYNLFTQSKLNSYLHDIDTRVSAQYDSLVKQLPESQGVNEQFKAKIKCYGCKR